MKIKRKALGWEHWFSLNLSLLPLIDALRPQSVNSVNVRDVKKRFVSRRVGRQLHQHLIEEDGLRKGKMD